MVAKVEVAEPAANPRAARTTKIKRAKAPPLTLPRAGALPLRGRLAYAGALVSGLLYFLAFAGFDVWPAAFVAFVPLIVSMHRQAPRRALALGLLSGLT